MIGHNLVTTVVITQTSSVRRTNGTLTNQANYRQSTWSVVVVVVVDPLHLAKSGER